MPMTTANDMIQDALQKLGVYATSETVSAADAAIGLTVLNDMMDSWSNESLTCFANLEQSLALVVGLAQYPLGPGSIYGTVRPLAITAGVGAAYVQDSNGNNYPCDVLTQEQWNMIGLRTVTSNVPDSIFYDPQYPQGLLNVFPVPNAGGYTLYWDSRLQLAEFPTLTTAVSLPLGYVSAIKYNLAIELSPYFQVTPSEVVVAMANKHKANIKRTNIKMTPAVYDPELVSRASPTYNIFRESR